MSKFEGVSAVAGHLAVMEYRISRLEGKNDDDAGEQAILLAQSYEEMVELQRELTEAEQADLSSIISGLIEPYAPDSSEEE